MNAPGRDFEGLVALVTGGASGIGAATATMLVSRGATVRVLDRTAGRTDDGIPVIAADVTDGEAVEAAVGQVVTDCGRLDVLVNNAGIGAAGTVADNSMEEWQRVLDVNVLGIVRVSRAALPYLRRSPAAAIVNTCSVAAEVGLPQRALYSASKGAVLALTRAMAADHLADGIRVCCVNPGTADTPWVGRLLAVAEDPDAERTALEARQPTGRLVSAQEVAFAIASLAGPGAGASTGISLTVDGGLTSLRLPAPRTRS